MTITDKQVEAAFHAYRSWQGWYFGGEGLDRAKIRAALEAAEAAREPADYPNPGAHTPLRPTVPEQLPAAQGEAATPYAYEFDQLMTDSMGGWARKIERNLPMLAKTRNVKPLYEHAASPQPSAPGVVSDALVEAIDKRFRSGNSVPVERAHITATEWAVLRARVTQPSADDAPRVARVTLNDPRGTPDHDASDILAERAAPPADARDADTTICGQCSAPFPRLTEPHCYCQSCTRADSDRLSDMQSEYWSVVCFSTPTGIGDHGVGWRVTQDLGDGKGETVIAEVFNDDLRDALDLASNTTAWPECSGDPACCPENEGYGCCKLNPEGGAK